MSKENSAFHNEDHLREFAVRIIQLAEKVKKLQNSTFIVRYSIFNSL